MKRSSVRINVTDHALVQFMERAMGLDIDGLRRQLESDVRAAAELGASAVSLGNVKLLLAESAQTPNGRDVAVTTVHYRHQTRSRREGEK